MYVLVPEDRWNSGEDPVPVVARADRVRDLVELRCVMTSDVSQTSRSRLAKRRRCNQIWCRDNAPLPAVICKEQS